MKDRLQRLIRIIISIQSRPGISAKELADKFQVSERTIYRDLQELSVMNIPISNDGHSKGYVFIGNFSLYPLNWTEQETVAFSMLPSLLQQVKDPLPKDFYSAYEKVMATSYKEKRVKQDLLQQVADVIQLGAPANYREQPNYLSPVIEAILNQKTMKAIYHTQSRNQTSERYIDPYYVVPREFRFYLVGFCHQKKEMRTFRLSRFKKIEVTKQRFEKVDFSLKSYFKYSWSIERGDTTTRFKVRFSPEVARYIKEEEMFITPKMTDLEDGSLLLEVSLNSDREFLRWLNQYGPEAEILEPKEYRDKMKEMLSQWHRLYG